MVPESLKHNKVYFKLKNIYDAYQKLKESERFEKESRKEFDFLKKQAAGKERFEFEWQDRWLWNDKTEFTGFDTHYVYHLAWAARILKKTNPALHIDIGSHLDFPCMLSAHYPIEFYDYRPANVKLDNLKCLRGDLLNLHFEDNSVHSLSCMHVLDHPGLGRYGDPLDYDGDLKAIKELQRVLAKGGNFLYVVPVGKPKIKFNASRIFGYRQTLEYFNELKLIEFSLIPDDALNRGMITNATEEMSDQQNYGCGCFWFTKE